MKMRSQSSKKSTLPRVSDCVGTPENRILNVWEPQEHARNGSQSRPFFCSTKIVKTWCMVHIWTRSTTDTRFQCQANDMPTETYILRFRTSSENPQKQGGGFGRRKQINASKTKRPLVRAHGKYFSINLQRVLANSRLHQRRGSTIMNELHQAQGLKWFHYLFLAPPTTATPPETMSPGKWNLHFSPDTGKSMIRFLWLFRQFSGRSRKPLAAKSYLVIRVSKNRQESAQNRARPRNESSAVCVLAKVFLYFQIVSL